MAGAAGSAPTQDALDSAAGWRVVAAATLGMAFGPSAVLMLSFGVIVTVLSQAFGWDPGKIALGSSFASISLIFASPLQGWLVDRFGPRKVILCGLPLWAIYLFIIASMPKSFPLFLFLCALAPFAGIGLWPVAYLTVPTRWFERHLGLAVGITNCGIGLGAFLIPLLLGFGIQHVGWRWSYAGIGIGVLLVVFPVLFFFLKEGSAVTASAPKQAGSAGSDWSFLRAPRFRILAASFFMLGVTGSSLLVFLVPILVDRGLPQERAIFIQSVLGIGTIVGRISAGLLLDRFSVRAVGIGIFILAACSALTIAHAGPGIIAPISALLLGLVVGAEFDLLAVAIRRFLGTASFGRMYGLAFAAVQVGSAIGIGFLGLMKLQYNSYALVLWIFGLVLIGAGALFSRIGGRDQEFRLQD